MTDRWPLLVAEGNAALRSQAPIAPRAACIGWARSAHYITEPTDHGGGVQLRSEAGARLETSSAAAAPIASPPSPPTSASNAAFDDSAALQLGL